MTNDFENIARELVKSLGGKRVLEMMINAKKFKFDREEKFLSFRFSSRNFLKANFIKILYVNDDLFNVEFGRIYGKKYIICKTLININIRDLCSVFENETKIELRIR